MTYYCLNIAWESAQSSGPKIQNEVVSTATPIKTKASDALAIGGTTLITLRLGGLPTLAFWVIWCNGMDAYMKMSSEASINTYTHTRSIRQIPVYYSIQEYKAGKTPTGHFNHPNRITDTL